MASRPKPLSRAVRWRDREADQHRPRDDSTEATPPQAPVVGRHRCSLSDGFAVPRLATAIPSRICSIRCRSCSCRASNAASKMGNSEGHHVYALLHVDELEPLLSDLDQLLALLNLSFEQLDAMPESFRGRRDVN